MARVQITRSDRFEDWRVKDNKVAATVGDVDVLQSFTQVTFAGLIGSNPPLFTGTPATFTITRNPDLTYTVLIATDGDGYAEDDVITILGSEIGGTDGVNDATLTVTAVGSSGEIAAVDITGISNIEIVAELNQLRSEVGNSVDDQLTTTAQTLYEAINELDALQGNVNLTTAAQTVTGAIVELDALQGNVDITSISPTDDTVTGALLQLHTEVGSSAFTAQGTSPNNLVTYVNLGSDHTTAINALKDQSDFLADEVGGVVADDYLGPDTNIISALNALYGASSISTLDNVYLRRDGTTDMTGVLKLDVTGIDSQTDDFLLKTNGSTRMTVNQVGSFGFGGNPSSDKVRIHGYMNANNIKYNGEDTDQRYLKTSAGLATPLNQTVFTNVTFEGSVTFNDPVNVGSILVGDDNLTIQEWVEDKVGTMFTSNVVSGGISSTYDDTTGKITLAIANNSHTHISTNITDWTEAVQDTVGAMFVDNTENGLAVTYDDVRGKINVDVNDPVLTFTGGATGSATITNLGNTTVNLTLDRESVQDLVGIMLQGNTETGITVTYDDVNNEIDFELSATPTIALAGDLTGSVALTNLATQTFTLTASVVNDSHTHTSSTISDFTEVVQDIVGTMVAQPNIEAGISVDYDDAAGKLSFNVIDPTITLAGDVTGSATMTNLGSITIQATVANDSHTHDGRYYTEAESDSRFFNVSGDTVTGNATIQGDLYVGKDGGGDSRLYFYDDNSNAWRGIIWDDSANAFVCQDNGGTWRTIIHSGNIGTQGVTTATNATNSTYSNYTYVTRTDATNANYYVNFSSIGNAQQRIRNDAQLYYNPSVNTLYTGIFSGTATSANYADLAEKYLADAEYPAGIVVAIGGEAEVTAATSEMAHSVIGVVSEDPAFMMNDKLEGGTYIALKGRVPVLVVGEVKKGDRLVASSTPGYAEVNNAYGVFSFAIALEDGSDVVEAVIL